MSRFIELFNQYDFNLNENYIKSDIEKILSESFDKNCDNAIYSKILSLIDLTSLNTD